MISSKFDMSRPYPVPVEHRLNKTTHIYLGKEHGGLYVTGKTDGQARARLEEAFEVLKSLNLVPPHAEIVYPGPM